MELQHRVAVVTGPAKGMGPAIVHVLAREGASIALAGRDLTAMQPVLQDVERLGRRALPVACDVTDEAAVDGMVQTVLAQLGQRIDILVNVAGGTGPTGRPIWDTTPAELDDILALNLKGCFLTMRAVLPHMVGRRYGKIVNVGGSFGLRGRALRAAYSASKWGLRGLTKSAALEAGPHNINVNAVCPGMVEGPRCDAAIAERARRLGITPDDARSQIEAEYALRRLSTADDVANAVLFLASERSRQITGQDLAVDGGWAM